MFHFYTELDDEQFVGIGCSPELDRIGWSRFMAIDLEYIGIWGSQIDGH